MGDEVDLLRLARAARIDRFTDPRREHFDGRAAFAYTDKAMLHLAGTLATWPDAWPALPPPIGQSNSPLPVVLDYAGPFDFSSVARVQLARDATRFDARFALPSVLAWIDAPPGSPLPPLSGRLTTPTLDVGGAILEGLPEIAEQIFDMPVRRGTPTGIGGLVDVVASPVYATAVGLVQCGYRNRAGRALGGGRQAEGGEVEEMIAEQARGAEGIDLPRHAPQH